MIVSTLNRMTLAALGAAVVLTVSGCAGMSQDQDTAAGAIGGAAAGAILDGGPVGVIGGAVAGGLIGHEVGKDKNPNQNQ